MLTAPGVRDRVVNIAFRDDEGGLNLDMSPSVISDLDCRGRAAGLLISARFDRRKKPIQRQAALMIICSPTADGYDTDASWHRLKICRDGSLTHGERQMLPRRPGAKLCSMT